MRHEAIARRRFGTRGGIWLGACCLLLVAGPGAVAGGRNGRSKATLSREFYEGRELFLKNWEPGKSSPAGGDGLGPLYNETSCVACHHLGGVGGAGGNDRNVLMLTAVTNPTDAERSGKPYTGDIRDLHAGFQDGPSVVIHRHSTDSSLERALTRIQSYSAGGSRGEMVGLRQSHRNTPSLFGVGRIDAIPDRMLVAAQDRKFANFPEITGRVSRLPDGRIGRFGWKAQTAALRDFVLAACSNELGLEVPGRHQASVKPVDDTADSAPKLDLDAEQCDLLIRYVRDLSTPVVRPEIENRTYMGYRIFESIGCAACHTPTLGRAEGLYSDLLLHDMGPSLADAATYYGGATPAIPDGLAAADEAARNPIGAAPAEWRTPPLWGIADSAPYLHDGRAMSLDRAIRLHGGEAEATVVRYARLTPAGRDELGLFLRSLTAAPRPRKSGAAAARPSNR